MSDRVANVIINYPELMKDWNYDKNGNLKPENTFAGSGRIIWWKCCKGHEWQASACNRSKERGCPYCAGKKILKGYNDLATLNPDLALEWDYLKNEGLSPENMSLHSNKNVWWKCSEGHRWQASVNQRSKGSKCPFCTNHKLLIGYNDLQTVNPKLAAEWNYEKNKNLIPKQVIAGAKIKVWWKCYVGHEWEATVAQRKKGTGCPYCSGKKVLKGYNDLATMDPILDKEWNYSKNGDLTPDIITLNCNKKIWWKCSKGHEWLSTPNNRNGGNGCPYCANQKVLRGYNDLKTVNPELAAEWNYERNENLIPEQVVAGSGVKTWWKCSLGHEWQASISSRNKGKGCPYCTNRMVSKGFNDLATKNAELAKEWNYEKNGVLTPDNIVVGSAKKIWWRCSRGHEWQASVVSRNKNHFCPICDRSKHSSISEKAIVYYIKQGKIVVEENKRIDNYELDIYIPSLKIGIEYDGAFYHRDIAKDIAKNKLMKEKGIYLIRFREPGLPLINEEGAFNYIIPQITKEYQYLNEPIIWLLNKLKIGNVDVDVDRDINQIYELFQVGEKKASICHTHPEVAEEWNYERNGDLTPDKVSRGNHLKVWWKCSEGHEWQAQIYSRCSGTGCPECAKKQYGAWKKKSVKQYDNQGNIINTFDSISEAERITGIKNLWYVCSGKRKSAGGYYWKYN